MISILAQERLLGFVLGTSLGCFASLEFRKRFHDSLYHPHSQFLSQSQIREPIFGKQFRSEFSLMWNKAVDQTFGPLVASLSSRKE